MANLYRVDEMEALIRTVLKEPSQAFLTSAMILQAINDGYKDVALKALSVECEHVVNTVSGSRLIPFLGHRVNHVIPALGGDATSNCPGCGGGGGGPGGGGGTEWPILECGSSHIDYTTQQMAVNETQVLSVSTPTTDATYTWSVIGVGSINPTTGLSTTYTAPAANPNCVNAVISLSLGGVVCDSLQIATNGNGLNDGNTAYFVSLPSSSQECSQVIRKYPYNCWGEVTGSSLGCASCDCGSSYNPCGSCPCSYISVPNGTGCWGLYKNAIPDPNGEFCTAAQLLARCTAQGGCGTWPVSGASIACSGVSDVRSGDQLTSACCPAALL